MIVVDIETSGVDMGKCGIWQIGAVELENPSNTFLEEARISPSDEFKIEGKTIKELFGFTERELRDRKKQTEKELIKHFFAWCDKIKIKDFICHVPNFDYAFLETKAFKHGLKFFIPYRTFDLHSIAQMKYFGLKKKFLFKEGKSDMGLKNILNFVGMHDNRKAHNALEDAKLTAECFSRIIKGKNLFPEFSVFKIPSYLKK